MVPARGVAMLLIKTTAHHIPKPTDQAFPIDEPRDASAAVSRAPEMKVIAGIGDAEICRLAGLSVNSVKSVGSGW